MSIPLAFPLALLRRHPGMTEVVLPMVLGREIAMVGRRLMQLLHRKCLKAVATFLARGKLTWLKTSERLSFTRATEEGTSNQLAGTLKSGYFHSPGVCQNCEGQYLPLSGGHAATQSATLGRNRPLQYGHQYKGCPQADEVY